MPRGRELIHIPVSISGSDEVLGEVVDLVFDARGRVSALCVMPAKGLFRKERRVGIEHFVSVSEEGAILAGAAAFEQDAADDDGCRLRGSPHGLSGLPIVLEEGREIGTVGDVILDEGSLEIWGFEVSDGALMDLLDGRTIVEAQGAFLRNGAVVLTNLSHMNLRPDGHPNS